MQRSEHNAGQQDEKASGGSPGSEDASRPRLMPTPQTAKLPTQDRKAQDGTAKEVIFPTDERMFPDVPPHNQESHSEARFDPPWSAGAAPADKYQVQHEFFLPGEGIDPEALKRNVRHHMGPDASIRVATYRDSDDSEMIDGYAIMSYNTLTSAIVQKVKDKSARRQPDENDSLRENRRLSVGDGLAGAGAIRETSRDTSVESIPVHELDNRALKTRGQRLVGVHVCNECDPPRVRASH